jgi:hypothetical protein
VRQRLGIDDRAKVRPRRARASYSCFSGEQIGAGRRELHVGSGVVYFQPAPFNGELQSGAVLRRGAPVDVQEWAVDPLDIDPAILNWFEGVRVFQQTAGLSKVKEIIPLRNIARI